MQKLLVFTRWVDLVSERAGRVACWLVLLACFVSAGNAGIRYLFSVGSNSWLEVQWYMFAGIVMFGTSRVLAVNEHVRVDVVYNSLSSRACARIDLLGLLFFVLPMTILMTWLSWPFFVDSYISREMSSNAGGLIRWPFKLIVPVGFAMLSVQAIAEVIKRIAYLRGQLEMNTHYEKPLQ